VAALALEAAVALATPPTGAVEIEDPAARALGFVRVEIREMRALAFSFSFTAVIRVGRARRRVCDVCLSMPARDGRNSTNSLRGCSTTLNLVVTRGGS